MLDAGIELEASRAGLVAEMCRTQPDAWTSDQLKALKRGTDASAKGIPLKRVYGSDFPYRETEQHVPADYDGVGLRASLAKGGFSNVWGAAMLPYRAADIADWPIQVSDLNSHYAAVLKLTGLSAKHDALEPLFPLHLAQPPALHISSQAKILLNKMEQNRDRLARAGICFGQARLAVRAVPERKAPVRCDASSGDTSNVTERSWLGSTLLPLGVSMT